jgi:xanthine dehydrogenase YagR molybdenum-binding subunit
MATAWPQKRRLIGKKHSRVDGPAKATGKAKYSFDINRPGMLFARILRCPYAHATITKIDTAAAEKMPGVRAVFVIKKAGDELFFAGDEVLALAADTEELMLDALRAVKVDFKQLDHLVLEEDALKEDKQTVSPIGPRKERQNLRPGGESKTDGFEAAIGAQGLVIHQGEYGASNICHHCLESHGLVAEWDQDGGLTIWASTQAVVGTAGELAKYFSDQQIDLPASKVRCITHHMGGGYGSKFGPDIQGKVCAELARKARKPVKLMLDRAEEATCGGTRPSAFGKVRIAANKEGKVVAYEVDSYGSPGIGASPTVNFNLMPYVYVFEKTQKKHTVVRLNTQSQRAMRAPGHPQSSFLTDPALDDLAAKLGLDPMEVRLKNLPQNDPAAAANAPTSFNAIRNTLYLKEIEIAAQMSDWKKKWHPPGAGKGTVKHGIGMALHTWGGAAAGPNECTVLIAADGSVTAQTSTQDLGTAQRTVTAIVVAEILGLEPSNITLKIGESTYGVSSGSGGSTTCPSQAPAALRAATAARDDLLNKVAAKMKVDVGDLELEQGKVLNKKDKKSMSWKEVCAKLGMEQAKGTGMWSQAESIKKVDPNDPKSPLANPNVSNVQVCGVQVAEVAVDTETGVVRCTKVYAVQDCGMIINLQGCISQVAGGVIMGVNYALFEERIMDRKTGRQVNADMEFYKLGGIKDMPEVFVHMHDMPERGVIGIGEPPTISTHTAVSNAIFNAIGVRVPHTPFTPDRVLAALAKGGK